MVNGKVINQETKRECEANSKNIFEGKGKKLNYIYIKRWIYNLKIPISKFFGAEEPLWTMG